MQFWPTFKFHEPSLKSKSVVVKCHRKNERTLVVFGNFFTISGKQVQFKIHIGTYQHGRKVKNVFKKCMRIKYVSHLFQIIVQSIISSRQPLFNHFCVNQISLFHLLAFQANIKSQLLEILRQSPTKLSKNVTRENDTSVNW